MTDTSWSLTISLPFLFRPQAYRTRYQKRLEEDLMREKDRLDAKVEETKRKVEDEAVRSHAGHD